MKYSIYVYYDTQDNIYVASIPELEGCMAHGATPEDAVREVQAACELWIEDAKESGSVIPKPNHMMKSV